MGHHAKPGRPPRPPTMRPCRSQLRTAAVRGCEPRSCASEAGICAIPARCFIQGCAASLADVGPHLFPRALQLQSSFSARQVDLHKKYPRHAVPHLCILSYCTHCKRLPARKRSRRCSQCAEAWCAGLSCVDAQAGGLHDVRSCYVKRKAFTTDSLCVDWLTSTQMEHTLSESTDYFEPWRSRPSTQAVSEEVNRPANGRGHISRASPLAKPHLCARTFSKAHTAKIPHISALCQACWRPGCRRKARWLSRTTTRYAWRHVCALTLLWQRHAHLPSSQPAVVSYIESTVAMRGLLQGCVLRADFPAVRQVRLDRRARGGAPPAAGGQARVCYSSPRGSRRRGGGH